MAKNRVYLAAPYADRNRAKDFAATIEANGYEITQRWWFFEGTEETKGAGFLQYCGELDVRGVRTADAMVLLNSSKSEGKAVEQGLAIAYGLPIIAIGERGQFSSNVFHYLPNYYWVPGLYEAVAKLKEVIGEQRTEFV